MQCRKQVLYVTSSSMVQRPPGCSWHVVCSQYVRSRWTILTLSLIHFHIIRVHRQTYGHKGTKQMFCTEQMTKYVLQVFTLPVIAGVITLEYNWCVLVSVSNPELK